MVNVPHEPSRPSEPVNSSRAAHELLKELGSSPEGQSAIEQIRAGRRQQAAPGNPDDIDRILREGTGAERSALLSASVPDDDDFLFAVRNGQPVPNFDLRMQQLAQEVPEINRSAGGLAGIWGKAVDIAGRPLGVLLDATDLPAEGIERIAGMLYWNELPLAERWSMGRLTYDSIWSEIFDGGGQKHAAVQAVYRGDSWDTIEKEFGNAWGNGIGHFIADPLWLIGGIPLISKLGKFGVPGAELAGRGINFSRVPIASHVPILKNMGRPVADQKLDWALSQLHAAEGVTDFTTGRQSGIFRRLFQASPRARVDQDFSHFTGILSSLRDPQLWSETGGQTRMAQMLDDLGRSVPSSLGGLEQTVSGRRMQQVLHESPQMNEVLRRMESLRPISANAFWDDATHLLKTVDNGQETTIPELLRQGIRLSPEDASRYANYRTVKVMDEFAQKGLPALYDLHKLPGADALEIAERFSSGMKTALSLSVLNTPSFVFMNWVNNAFMIAAKGGDVTGALRYARQPTKLGKRELQIMSDLGMDDAHAASLFADTAFQQEYLPIFQEKNVRSKLLRKASGFVGFASKFDQGARVRVGAQAYQEAAHAVWKTGDGGLLDDIPDSLKEIPGFTAWVQGLGGRNFDALDTMLNNVAMSDDLVSAHSVVADWVAQAAVVRNASDPAEAARIVMSQFDGAWLDDLDDVISNVREIRRSGQTDWIDQLYRGVDDMHDEMSLAVYDAKLKDAAALPSIPTNTIRDRVAPWQDAASFSRIQKARRELYSRLVQQTPSPHGPQVRQQQLGQIMEQYEQNVREIMDFWGKAELNPDRLGEFQRTWQRELASRNERLLQLFPEDSVLGRMLKQEADQLTELHGLRDPADWAASVRKAQVTERAMLADSWAETGLDYARQTSFPEYPMSSDILGAKADHIHQVLDHMKTTLPERLRNATTFSEPQVAEIRKLINGGVDAGDGVVTGGLREAMRQRNYVAQLHARAMRDFTMLNYSRKYGFDGVLSIVAPYHFWIGRTSLTWMKMAQSRPGGVAAMARLYEMVGQINTDAGIPDRLKRNLRLAVPFLGDIPGSEVLMGGPGAMFFDPIQVLYPLAGLQTREDFGGENRTWLGQLHDYAAQLPIGSINPFMTGALGAVGALGDRDAYVRRSLSSVRGLPFGIPGPRTIRAASDWLTGVSDDPDPEYLTPELKERLANGEPLPDSVLHETLGKLADMASSDGWNGYRADRMVANLVGENPDRWTPRDGLEALRYHRGPLWTEAVRRSKQDNAATVLTGWALMPVRAYPEGEQVQRGLDAIFREVQQENDPAHVDAFFKQHPEYRVRRVAMLDRNDPEGQRKELDTSLFYMDVGAIQTRYEPEIEQLRSTLREAEELNYLETNEGRRMAKLIQGDIAILTEQRQAEIDRLDRLYPGRSKELSLKASPRERAMHQLREQFFAIRRDDYRSDDEYYAARESFLGALSQETQPDGSWLQYAVQSVAIWDTASNRMSQQPERAREHRERRDEELRALTERAGPLVSRTEFEAYLSRGQRAPTKQRIEYQQASQEINSYLAINNTPGLTETQKKAYKRAYWKSHPLLAKYYGNSEPTAWNAESAAAYGLMDQIWEGYYDWDGDARGQRDYLALHLKKLNAARQQVGLYPIKLVDWTPATRQTFQQPPSSPGEIAALDGLDSERLSDEQ